MELQTSKPIVLFSTAINWSQKSVPRLRVDPVTLLTYFDLIGETLILDFKLLMIPGDDKTAAQVLVHIETTDLIF